ncbi:hypothetical protein M433DRAFT_254681 [Acidomyces richmondensis BFW]|nr:hypothetical protein M433DRAFT_254681 [Acidomyces richmondensis BFW]
MASEVGFEKEEAGRARSTTLVSFVYARTTAPAIRGAFPLPAHTSPAFPPFQLSFCHTRQHSSRYWPCSIEGPLRSAECTAQRKFFLSCFNDLFPRHELEALFSSSSSSVHTLDFDARVPVPFSVFPSTYKNEQATAEVTQVKSDERISVQGAGREEFREDRRYQQGPSRRDDRYTREDIRISETDRYRPGRVRREENIRITEDDRYTDRRDTRIEVDRER